MPGCCLQYYFTIFLSQTAMNDKPKDKFVCTFNFRTLFQQCGKLHKATKLINSTT